MAQTKLLVIEESVLTAMASNPNFTKEFSFLEPLSKLKKTATGCGKCNRTASRRAVVMNGLKLSIISMGAEKKHRLKQLLNAERVRVRVAQNGQVKDYTF